MIGREGDYVVDPDSGCWVWQLSVNPKGYGRVKRGGVHNLAHRWYYEQHCGAVPDGLQLDHLCRNPTCVNPDHLEPVTPQENTQRGATTRLTRDDVHKIRWLWEQGFRNVWLADLFGVGTSAIHSIISGQTWKNVRPVCHRCREENTA